jgi:hypothetical protein
MATNYLHTRVGPTPAYRLYEIYHKQCEIIKQIKRCVRTMSMNRVHMKVQTTPAMLCISNILNKMNHVQYITGVLLHHSPSAKKKYLLE